MSDNGLQSFEQGVASFLTSCIFPAIVTGLAADGHDTTIDKLLQYSKTPIIRSVPSMAASTTTTSSAAPRKKAATATLPPAPTMTSGGEEITNQGTPFVLNKTCAYRFKRGPEIKGKYCGKITQNGAKFCNIKSHKTSEKDSPISSGIAPNPEMAIQQNSNGNTSLDVEEYDNDHNLFKDKTYGFIVTPNEEQDGVVIVLGRLNSDNNIVALTQEERVIASKIGLQFPVIEEEEEVPEAKSVEPITMAQIIPQMQTIPTIPQMLPQIIPVIPQKFNIPTIPTIPTMSSVPTH